MLSYQVIMDSWLILDCNTSRSSRDENERGTKGAVNPVFAAFLECQCPSQTEQTLHVGHTSITGEKSVEINQMMKLKYMPVPFILFYTFVKSKCSLNNFEHTQSAFPYTTITIVNLILVLIIFDHIHGTESHMQGSRVSLTLSRFIIICYDMCRHVFHSSTSSLSLSFLQDEPSLVSGCLNTATFATLLD